MDNLKHKTTEELCEAYHKSIKDTNGAITRGERDLTPFYEHRETIVKEVRRRGLNLHEVLTVETVSIVPAPMTVEQAVTFYAMLNSEGKTQFLNMLTETEREAIINAYNPNYERDKRQSDKVLSELGIDTK